MKFHHMAIMVSDTEKALRLWRDLLGFKVIDRRVTPDGIMVNQQTMDDIVHVKGAKFEYMLVAHDDGAVLEINRSIVPEMITSPHSAIDYSKTGIRELGLEVTDIDGWFRKVREAGYETQTEYVWNAGPFGRSFLFFDQDHNLIQFFERSDDVQLEAQEEIA